MAIVTYETVADVCRLTGFVSTTVKQWVRIGALPAAARTKRGTPLFNPKVVRVFLAKRRRLNGKRGGR